MVGGKSIKVAVYDNLALLLFGLIEAMFINSLAPEVKLIKVDELIWYIGQCFAPKLDYCLLDCREHISVVNPILLSSENLKCPANCSIWLSEFPSGVKIKCQTMVSDIWIKNTAIFLNKWIWKCCMQSPESWICWSIILTRSGSLPAQMAFTYWPLFWHCLPGAKSI